MVVAKAANLLQIANRFLEDQLVLCNQEDEKNFIVFDDLLNFLLQLTWSPYHKGEMAALPLCHPSIRMLSKLLQPSHNTNQHPSYKRLLIGSLRILSNIARDINLSKNLTSLDI
jgi:hypothetical protein